MAAEQVNGQVPNSKTHTVPEALASRRQRGGPLSRLCPASRVAAGLGTYQLWVGMEGCGPQETLVRHLAPGLG